MRHLAERMGVSPDSLLYKRLRGLYRGEWSTRSWMRSYSSYGEDVFLSFLLDGSRSGFFVDVGAGRPVHHSNTYGLYRKGWAGVTIDPIRSNVAEARRRRPRYRHVHALVSDVGESGRTFYEYSDWLISTTSEERKSELSRQGKEPVAAYSIQTVALRDLGVAASPDEPSLLSVDVEGWELAVLNGNDWNQFRPRVICIEDWASPLFGSTPVRTLLEDVGYGLVAHVGYTSTYMHADWVIDFGQ